MPRDLPITYSEMAACEALNRRHVNELNAEIKRLRAQIHERVEEGQKAIDALQEIADLPPGSQAGYGKFAKAQQIAKLALGQRGRKEG